MNVLKQYMLMEKEWLVVLAQPVSDEAKQVACLSVFRQHVGQIAMSHYGRPDAALRFYLDIFLLKNYFGSIRDLDDYDQLVKAPLSSLLREWLQSNVHQAMREPAAAEPLRLTKWPSA